MPFIAFSTNNRKFLKDNVLLVTSRGEGREEAKEEEEEEEEEGRHRRRRRGGIVIVGVGLAMLLDLLWRSNVQVCAGNT